jgi:hypothetical protein
MLIGTAAYLSPEQARGGELGAPSDIYSLGLVLLEALTRTREFPGPMMEAVSARLVRDPTIPGSIDAEWRSLLASMTAREPASRPTAMQVAEQARGVLAARSFAGAVVPMVDGPDEGLAPTRVLEATPTVLIPQADVAEAVAQRRRARRAAPIVVLVLVAVAVLITAAVLGGTALPQLIHPSTVPTTPTVGSSQVPTPVVSFTPVPTPTIQTPTPTKGDHGPGHGKKKHHG